MLAENIHKLMHVIWLEVQQLKDQYVRETCSASAENEQTESEGFIYASFEFFDHIMRKQFGAQFFSGVQDNCVFLKEFLWVLIFYMQITNEQVSNYEIY